MYRQGRQAQMRTHNDKFAKAILNYFQTACRVYLASLAVHVSLIRGLFWQSAKP